VALWLAGSLKPSLIKTQQDPVDCQFVTILVISFLNHCVPFVELI
jgi:hypothetical protein